MVAHLRPARPLLGLLALAALVAACGSGTHAAAPGGARLTVVGEAQNGTTVALQQGATVMLVLHSTAWTLVGSSNPAVLRATTAAQPHAARPGLCLPGMGCGTVEQRYSALADGSATLTARRTSCGEALACRPDQASYRVTVRVSG